MKTTGNTILITGGGSGIGRGLAEAFHKLGNQVIIAGRRKQILDDTTAANPGMSSVVLNIENPADIRKVAAKLASDHPALNAVIHNAGIMRPENLLAQPEDLADAEAIITTNLLSPCDSLPPCFRSSGSNPTPPSLPSPQASPSFRWP
jgi:uncharacterized oxidoreductase